MDEHDPALIDNILDDLNREFPDDTGHSMPPPPPSRPNPPRAQPAPVSSNPSGGFSLDMLTQHWKLPLVIAVVVFAMNFVPLASTVGRYVPQLVTLNGSLSMIGKLVQALLIGVLATLGYQYI